MNLDPDPKYVDHLEWQLRTASRRQGRFARPVPSVPVRAVRTAALIVLCLIGGAGAVMAAEHVQDEERKQLLVEKLRIEVEMAELRLEHAQTQMARTKQLIDSGLVSHSELRDEKARLSEVRTALMLRMIDLEEVEATGTDPNHSLSAPLVNGEDLVTKRLMLRIVQANVRENQAQEAYAWTKELAETGAVSRQELAGETAAIKMVHEEVLLLEESVFLRDRFVKGEIDAAQVELLQRVSAAKRAVSTHKLKLEGLAEKLEVAKRLEESGFAYNEVRGLELELQLAHGELRLAELELARLQALTKEAEGDK